MRQAGTGTRSVAATIKKSRGMVSPARGHGGKPLSDWEFRNEQALIGAVLLMGHKDKRVQGWLRKVTGWHFGEPAHSWLWSQLRKGPLTAKVCRECREKFRAPLVRIVDGCLEAGFWWWGDWYVEQILEAAVRRKEANRV